MKIPRSTSACAWIYSSQSQTQPKSKLLSKTSWKRSSKSALKMSQHFTCQSSNAFHRKEPKTVTLSRQVKYPSKLSRPSSIENIGTLRWMTLNCVNVKSYELSRLLDTHSTSQVCCSLIPSIGLKILWQSLQGIQWTSPRWIPSLL